MRIQQGTCPTHGLVMATANQPTYYERMQVTAPAAIITVFTCGLAAPFALIWSVKAMRKLDAESNVYRCPQCGAVCTVTDR